MNESRSEELGIAPAARRIAVAGLAASALALGFAVPARADDAPPPLPAPAPSTETTVVAPTPPDTSAAAAAVDAAAAQVGATNVDVSVRIASPGDNGAVTQTIAGQADAAQTVAQSDTATEAASTEAAATQVAPANVAVSVRIASPGTDGPVTQAVTVDASAETQYQPSPDQYQEPPPVQPASQPTSEAGAAEQPPVAAATDAQSLPSAWTWNWTWTCGDTTGSGITETIDTGIQGWIWTWNLDPICATPPTPVTPVTPINPPQSSGVISPSVPLPVPPVPPQLQEPVPPQLPEPVTIVPPAPALAVELLPATDAIAPVAVPAASLDIAPPSKRIAPLFSASMQPQALPWTGRASLPAASTQSRPVRTHEQTASKPQAQKTVPLEVLAFPPPPAGGSGGGGTGGGSGVAAALAIWMLLQLPGLAVLRLPPSRRSPRARTDDIPSRPG